MYTKWDSQKYIHMRDIHKIYYSMSLWGGEGWKEMNECNELNKLINKIRVLDQ